MLIREVSGVFCGCISSHRPRIRRLIYGATDPKAGAVESVMRVLDNAALNHRIEVKKCVLAGRCMELVQAFFRDKRAR